MSRFPVHRFPTDDACGSFVKMRTHNKAQSMLSVDIESWLVTLIANTSSVREVWLFGSRANGNPTETSDWDLLMVVNQGANVEVANLKHFARTDVDLLVDADGKSFETVWGTKKTGSYLSWNWTRQDTCTATYAGQSWVPDADVADDPPDMVRNSGKFLSSPLSAIRVWSPPIVPFPAILEVHDDFADRHDPSAGTVPAAR